MNALRVAIVGYGLAGRAFHGQLIRATEGLAVAAVVTSSAERAAQAVADHPGAHVLADLDALLALPPGAIDLVVLATPHDSHAEFTLRALNAGLHVVTDKIMALKVADAEAMIAASQRNQRILTVFQNRRWDSDFLTLRRLLSTAAVGDPLVIASSVVRAGPDASPAPPADERPWRQRADRGGGPLRDWGAHPIDQALLLGGGLPKAVVGELHYGRPGLDVETLATCTLRFESGLHIRIEAGGHSFLPKPRWYVQGTKGSVSMLGLDPQEAYLRRGEVVSGSERARFDAANIAVAPSTHELDVVPGDYLAFYANVRDAIAQGTPLAVAPESCRDGLRVLEAALQSAATQQVVFLA